MRSDSPQLEYAPKPALLRRRWRAIVVILTIALVSLCGFVWREKLSAIWLNYQELRAQRIWLKYQIDPNRVVYDDDPERASELATLPDYFDFKKDDGAHVTMWHPNINDPHWSTSNMTDGALLFLHERITEGGRRLLTTVHLYFVTDPTLGPGSHLMFQLQEFVPYDWGEVIQPRNGLLTPVLGLDFSERKAPVRIFGGQVDPDDRTHFTIRYQIGDKEGILDGYDGERMVDSQGIPTPGLRLEARKKKGGSP